MCDLSGESLFRKEEAHVQLRLLSQSIQAMVTKFHTVQFKSSRNLLHRSGGWKFKINIRGRPCPGEGPLHGGQLVPSHLRPQDGGAEALSGPSFIRALIPPLILLSWGFGISICKYGGNTNIQSITAFFHPSYSSHIVHSTNKRGWFKHRDGRRDQI